MKILQVVGDSKYGGDSYLVGEWCRFLLDRGCEVHGLSTDRTTRTELSRVRGLVLFDSIHIPRDVRPMAHLKAVVKLARLILRERYDIVHTHTSTPGVVGRFAAWFGRTPVRLHTAHGWPVSEYSGFAARWIFGSIERSTARISSLIICVSHATMRRGLHFKLASPHKLITIRHGIETAPFMAVRPDAARDLRTALGVPREALLVGATSRLAPQKDVPTLLRATVALLQLLGPREFVLLLAGEGPESLALQKLCGRLGIASHVRFLGFRRDIPVLLAAVDVFVTTSLWEGLSVSILEAMAAAKPIVATDIEANAEVIDHQQTGLLVPVGSPDHVARAIARFAADPDLAARCGSNARRRLLLEDLTIERTCAEQWQLYTTLLRASSDASRSASR